MSHNNSKTNRNIRRTAALSRFKMSPTGSLRNGRTEERKQEVDLDYLEMKSIEKAALTKHVNHSYEAEE